MKPQKAVTTFRVRITIALTAVILTMTPILRGQTAVSNTEPIAEPKQVVPFLEGTYVFRTVPVARILFEAHIQPNLVIRQNLTRQLVFDKFLNSRVHFARSVVAVPAVRLRMIKENSLPVRTPSYMPKVTFTEMMFRGESGDRVGIWAGQLTVGHHSNGQDGCLFTTDDPKTCTGPADLHQINTSSGSFGTNYVRIGGKYRREWLKPVDDDVQIGYKESLLSQLASAEPNRC